jgi:aerobic carbon-monoxide dehydrogenase medium subunit
MYQFNYHRAKSVDEAANLAGKSGDAKYLAGGHTLLPTMKQRLASPADIVDLSGIAALKGIAVAGGTVSIGALVTHAEVASSKDIAKAIPALATLAGNIGDPHVRNRGTIGGSVANNDPAADYPAACLGLGATIVTNKREIAADSYFTGMFSTALQDNEVITKIVFPVPKRAGYAKFANRASRYAIVGVMVAETAGGVRVAVTGAGEGGVFRSKELETALAKGFTAAAAGGTRIPAAGLNSDIHASADYRAHLIAVMAKRAVTAAG